MNREQWLTDAVGKLTPLFRGAGLAVPELRVSCGFPSKGGLATKKKVIGECWDGLCAADGKPQLFISPMLCDAATAGGVLATLVHEMVHAAIGTKAKHGPKFKRAMKQVGLEGKPTTTTADAAMVERLHAILSDLGPYPHSELKHTRERKVQTTRMHKAECDCCGYTVRLAKKWADFGPPICPTDKKPLTMEIPEEVESE
jgi:hypothetical protein